MAEKGPGSTGRTAKKRLARAKIKSTDNGIKSSKGRDAQQAAAAAAEQGEGNKDRLKRIIIGVFAVLMALSMTLPSLSYIFGKNSDADEQAAQQQAAQQAAEEEASDEAEADEAEEQETQTATGIDAVDNNYKAVVVPLEEKLDENKDDLATLLNLGNDYMAWASEVGRLANDDAGTKHMNELFDKAIGYYDRYLELNDSNAVRVDRALCQFYSGDTEGANAALEKLTTDAPDYGPAWANLGLLYEYQGQKDKAKEAYQQAALADPDDEYGAKSYADRRIAAMAAASSGGDLTDGAADVTSSDGSSSLADALGTGL